MLRALLAAGLLALAVPVAASAVPQELSGDRPISVDGRTIELAAITKWARIAAHSGGDRRARRIHFRQAAQLLISQRWLAGEAARLGIVVTPRQVTRRFRRLKRDTFPRARGYRRFLRESGQSTADIRRRVRFDLVAERIRRHVTRGAADAEEEQRQLEAFVADFRRRWREVTLCTPRFARSVRECGNYQTVSNSSS